jgi:hypothetical protein
LHDDEDAAIAPKAAAARRNSRNSSPVRTGKPFVE